MDSIPAGTDPGDHVDEVLVSTGGNAKFHIPRGDRPLCATAGEFRKKSLAVYPPAHRNWCRTCRRLWMAHTDGGE